MHSNFYLEFVWHHELIGLNGVKVVFLLVLLSHLLSVLLLLLHFHLLLHLHLLIWVHLTHHLLLLLHLEHLLFVHHLLLLLSVHILLFLDHLLTTHILGGFFHCRLWLLGFTALSWWLFSFGNWITHFYYKIITSKFISNIN